LAVEAVVSLIDAPPDLVQGVLQRDPNGFATLQALEVHVKVIAAHPLSGAPQRLQLVEQSGPERTLVNL
jgi:hypothetical protein